MSNMCNFIFTQIIWVAVGHALTVCYAQDVLFRHEDEEDDLVQRNFIKPAKIPETVLIGMKDIHNVTEFMNRFLNLGSPVNPLANDSLLIINGRNALSGQPRAPTTFAQPALCQPEDHIVELERPENGAVMLWPSCVRVKRCGGCCTSKMLTCNAIATSTINVTVLQVRYNPQAPNSFEDQGTREFTLEQHDRCACGCKETPTDCTPSVHEYRADECRCVCINQEKSSSCNGPKRIWDSKDCMCKCRRLQQCSTGRYYNIRKCKCEVLRNSLVANGLENFNTSRNGTVRFNR